MDKKFRLSLKCPLVLETKKRLISQIKMGTKEWTWKNANCIQGCPLCIYCYAKAMAKRLHITEEIWQNRVIMQNKVKKNYNRQLLEENFY